MKYLDVNYYVEVKYKRYRIHPTETITLRLLDQPIFLRIQCQVLKDTQIGKNQKIVENIEKLEVKNYPRSKQPLIHQPEFKTPSCPTCKQNIWLEFDKGYFCRNCEYVNDKQRHQVDKKVRRKIHNFSTRLNYAIKKIREIWMNMVNTTYDSTEDMIDKLKQLKGKTKL